MDSKENDNNENEEQNQDSGQNEHESDDFGLPDIENTDDPASDYQKKQEEYNPEEDSLGSPYSDSPEEDNSNSETYSDPYAYNEGSDANTEYNYESESTGYGDDNPVNDDEFHDAYYDEGEKQGSPVGWIILGIVLVIGLGIGAFWWFNRTPEPPKATFKPPKTTPAVTQPDTTAQTVDKAPPKNTAPQATTQPESTGAITEISEPTGRYYVVIASFIDDDLANDYAKKLSKEGVTCKILAPQGKKKFFRFSIADFPTVNDAALKAEQVKSTYGEGVWVMKY